MKTALFIARRYLFAKKSHHVINIISLISVLGVTVGTAGLIVVLSVFNGFSDLVLSLYNSFDPAIKITAVRGKTFDPSTLNIAAIRNTEGVSGVSFTLSENALLKYGEKQHIATIKGVDTAFMQVTGVGDFIVDGSASLNEKNEPFAIAGGGVAYTLSLSLTDPFNVLSIYMPKKGKPVALTNPEEAFNVMLIRPGGVFSIQQDFDSKYVLVPLAFARELMEENKKVSAIEVGVHPGVDENMIKDQIMTLAGNHLKVQTRIEQHELLYKILQSEKWAIYLILSFILIIAIFNITGSLTMLILEKKKDIATLNALGAGDSLIRNIFLAEGMMITLFGALAGMLLGGIICWLQMEFGLIKLNGGDAFLVDAYPVVMEAADFLLTTGIVSVIGFSAALYASGSAVRAKTNLH
jgi:lipoprotein-releasing system permease protein